MFLALQFFLDYLLNLGMGKYYVPQNYTRTTSVVHDNAGILLTIVCVMAYKTFMEVFGFCVLYIWSE